MAQDLHQLELSHLRNLRTINDKAESYGTEVDSMIANERKDHEARKIALVGKGIEYEAKRKNDYDAATTIELAKIDDVRKSLEKMNLQLEREIIEGAATVKDVGIAIDREIFNEVDGKREINDRKAELYNEKLNEKRKEIQLAEEQKLKEEQNERKLHGKQMIAEIHEQMNDQRNMGNLKTSTQNSEISNKIWLA